MNKNKRVAREQSRPIVETAYKKAFRAVNGKGCKLEYQSGWYRVNGGKTCFQLADLAVMALVLQYQLTKQKVAKKIAHKREIAHHDRLCDCPLCN